MGVVEVALVLLGVAAVASISGYIGSAVQRRRRRRASRIFALGFVCGAWVNSLARDGRWRRLTRAVRHPRSLGHRGLHWELTR